MSRAPATASATVAARPGNSPLRLIMHGLAISAWALHITAELALTRPSKPALAMALVASIADPEAFRSGRDFSAWVGLVPKQNSSGGKDKLGSIGALAVIRYAKIHGTQHRP